MGRSASSEAPCSFSLSSRAAPLLPRGSARRVLPFRGAQPLKCGIHRGELLAVRIATRNLRELQQAMKRLETSIEPADVKPILAGALEIFKAEALRLLRALTKRTQNLPAGWEHIEDALKVVEGKSDRIARAYAKVFRRASPQAIWIEFGHRIVGHKPNEKDAGKHVTANPFFRPAINISRAAMLKHVRDGVRVLLQSEAERSGFRGKG
jgi:hypothetical protein